MNVWTFTAIATDPAGVRVEATITVPEGAIWSDFRDCAETAQSMVGRALADITRMREEEPPF